MKIMRNYEETVTRPTCETQRRSDALRAFIAGYLHGRSALGNHDAAGREAEAAFNKWWAECGVRKGDR